MTNTLRIMPVSMTAQCFFLTLWNLVVHCLISFSSKHRALGLQRQHSECIGFRRHNAGNTGRTGTPLSFLSWAVEKASRGWGYRREHSVSRVVLASRCTWKQHGFDYSECEESPQEVKESK